MATAKVKSSRRKRQANAKDNSELDVQVKLMSKHILLARRSSQSLDRARRKGDEAAIKRYYAQFVERAREFDKCSAKINKILKNYI